MTAEVVADSAIKSKTKDYVSGLSSGLKETNEKGGRVNLLFTLAGT
jgi:hypothetical protein